ncbi:hypothetical protein ACFOET_08255 [Parapedobacter deserti]|uniref:BZIP transcription factor n=2 Tax=Parapedobacter deserti TaxID=1912957 RepID=A0ABV7JNE1_9SPHI
MFDKHLAIVLFLTTVVVLCNAQTNQIQPTGNVGIGTTSPTALLDIRGRIVIENGGDAAIFTGTANQELNRYLSLFNSEERSSASGLRAGGILVSDSYSYANPGKNDLVVKGNIGVGVANPAYKLDVRGGGASISGTNPIISVNGFNNMLQLQNAGHSAIVYNPGEDTELMFGFHSNGNFYWGSKTNGYGMTLTKSGQLNVETSVSIGDKKVPGYTLSVDGKVAAKEINVTINGWADYVFKPHYQLRPLTELETYIKEHGHLPGIPSAQEVDKNGVDLGEMNRKLLEKVEELTLYILKQQETIDQLIEKTAHL